MAGLPPSIGLRQRAARRGTATGLWLISWCVENLATDDLAIISVKLPHGQFRARLHNFVPPVHLAAGATAEFEAEVRCDEKPGLITENAFVIFESLWRKERWRVFGRVRVDVDTEGVPGAMTQSITTQQVGFSKNIENNG